MGYQVKVDSESQRFATWALWIFVILVSPGLAAYIATVRYIRKIRKQRISSGTRVSARA